MFHRDRTALLFLHRWDNQGKKQRGSKMQVLCKSAGIKQSEVLYYWPSLAVLAKEVGARPNEFKGRLDDNVVFQEYAKVCLHLGKIPNGRSEAIGA